MAKRTSLLAPAVATQPAREPERSDPPAARTTTSPPGGPRASSKRPGKYHLGAYFDPADPAAEAFRVLAARTRRSQQSLLAEAIGDLVAKYDADEKFGRP
jgi:hypothetical protein